MSDERVKPCLRCEELFDFELSYCPTCGALAQPIESPSVPHDLKPPGPRGRLDLVLVVSTAALATLATLAAIATALVG